MIHNIRVSKRALLQAISTCHSHKCARHSTQSELTAPTLTKDNICIIGGHKVRALRNDNGRTTIQHPQFYTHKSVAGRISLISAKCPVRRDDDSGGIFLLPSLAVFLKYRRQGGSRGSAATKYIQYTTKRTACT